MDWTLTQLVIIGTAIACLSTTSNKSLWITLCVIFIGIWYLVQSESSFYPPKSYDTSTAVSSMQTTSNPTERKMTPNPYLKSSRTTPSENSVSLLETSYDKDTSKDPVSGNEWFQREQERYESQVFHGGVRTPSQASRTRLLQSMYDELEATNVKRDPFLSASNPNDTETNEDCKPLRGSQGATYDWM